MEIKRDLYLNTLIEKKHNKLVKIITGMRRSGKSYLLNVLLTRHLVESGVPESHIISIQLDKREFKDLTTINKLEKYIFNRIKDQNMYYLLIDEIQTVKNFQKLLNSLSTENNIDVYATGSNAKFLSHDIITEFRGRSDEIHVFPLSFKEFFDAIQLEKNIALEQYLNFGGLPYVTSNCVGIESKQRYLANILRETFILDIVERHKLKDLTKIEELIKILSSNVGSLTNPSKLNNIFNSKHKEQIKVTTINSYLNWLTDSFMISKSLRYDVRGNNYIQTPSKYYFEDIGIKNAVIDFKQIDKGHILENVVYNELKIRGYKVDVGTLEIYEKNKDNKTARKKLEIDFVCSKGNEKLYIQVASDLNSAEKIKQEKRPLLYLKDGFKKIIIVGDSLWWKQYDENGILIINIFDFLNSENSI